MIPAQFDYVSDFSDGLAYFRVGNSDSGKYGFINQTGEVVIPAKFDYVSDFSEGLAHFMVGDLASRKYGFIRNPLNT